MAKNSISVDYLIVGSGLTGAVIARKLADAGREVLVLERRAHLGGNVHDSHHPSGIRVHTYGPHYFHTSSQRQWEFVTTFGDFYKFEAVVKSYVDGRNENWPVAGSYIKRVVGEDWAPAFRGTPANFEEACLAVMPRIIFEKFIEGYSEKQWGAPAQALTTGLKGRFDLRADDDPRLRKDKYQGLPVNGYAELMRSMLAGIPVLLNFDYLERKDDIHARKLLVFTGPIDEFFGFDLGRLAYRGQRRVHEYLPEVDYSQPSVQVNNPHKDNGAHTRTLEWKHLLPAEYAERIRGTVLTREVPFSPTDPDAYEYPFPDKTNAVLYRQYRARAGSIDGLLVCGRLGEYRYYDMDQAIGRAMVLAQRVLEKS